MFLFSFRETLYNFIQFEKCSFYFYEIYTKTVLVSNFEKNA